MLIAIAGGGGKTTTMMYLAEKAIADKKSVIITTSTHIMKPEGRLLLYAQSAGEAYNYINSNGIPESGIVIAGSGEEKLKGLDRDEISLLKKAADLILVEADGAKMLPLKLPSENEPAIPENSDRIIYVCGLDALDRRADEVCFRYELGSRLFNWEPGHIISEKDIADILTSKHGGLKGVCKTPLSFILNKADDEALEKRAERIRNMIEERMKLLTDYSYDVIINSYRKGGLKGIEGCF